MRACARDVCNLFGRCARSGLLFLSFRPGVGSSFSSKNRNLEQTVVNKQNKKKIKKIPRNSTIIRRPRVWDRHDARTRRGPRRKIGAGPPVRYLVRFRSVRTGTGRKCPRISTDDCRRSGTPTSVREREAGPGAIAGGNRMDARVRLLSPRPRTIGRSNKSVRSHGP